MPLPFVFIFTRFARTVISLFRNPDSRGLLGLTGLVIASGATFYHYVEGWEWLDSFYFTVITLTTIGYGDFTPKTDVGKLFTMVYVFIGLGILLSFIDMVANHQKETPSLFRRGTRPQTPAEPPE
ncbi:MAG: two pore domain potassium channel family protein [Chloroflexi bacterium]|nr:two pore domain potassium channel family protein [Chloroflexota bacterium]MBP8055236.1 two pore domain potassium channel family protein [Chloroflexota bacterium]